MRSRSARFAAAALVAVLVVAGLIATSVGPGFAHTPHDQISDIAVSPDFAQDATAFAISDSRPMRSTDGGRHWVELTRGLSGQNFQNFAIAPSNPRVMYLSALNAFNLGEQRTGPGVFRSDDQGSTWSPATGNPTMSNVTRLAVAPKSPDLVLAAIGLSGGLSRTTDGGRTWSPVPGIGLIGGMTFVPDRPGRVVLGDATGLLHVSNDDGATLRTVARAPEGRGITAIGGGTKGAGSTLFAGTAFGNVMRSDDGGTSWDEIGAGVPDQQQVQGFALSDDYEDDHTVWVSTFHHGVYRSTDGGATWKPVFDGLTLDGQADQLKLPQFGDLVATRDAAGKQRMFLVGYDGLFTSSGGIHWDSIETLAEYVTGLAVSPDYANDGTIVVNTYVKGVFVSRDSGATFTANNKGLGFDISEGNKLLPVRRMHNVVFSPGYATDRTIFTATWDRFVKSTNAGRTWTTVVVSPPPPGTALRQFVIAVSPGYTEDQTLFLGSRQGDVYRSTKGGAEGSWVPVANLRARVRSIAVSPGFATDRTLFAGTEAGTFVSRDAGTTWTATGPKGISLLAMSPAYPTDGTVFAGTEHGLFVTRDHGATWTEVTASPFSSSSRIAAIAASPDFERDRMLLVSIAGTGLFRSTDGGESYAAVGRDLLDRDLIITDFENPTSEPLQFSPAFAKDRTIYAYAQQSVVRSVDGGDTWKVLDVPPAAEFTALNVGSRPASESSDDSGSGLPVVLVVLAGGVVLAGVAFALARRRTRRSHA